MTAVVEICKFCGDTGVVWFAGLFSLDDRRLCTCATGEQIFESVRTAIVEVQEDKLTVPGLRR